MTQLYDAHDLNINEYVTFILRFFDFFFLSEFLVNFINFDKCISVLFLFLKRR